MWHDPDKEPVFSEYLELDLSTVVASIAGPKRPQDRIELSDAKNAFRKDIHNYVEENHPAPETARRSRRGVLPGQRPGVAVIRRRRRGRRQAVGGQRIEGGRASRWRCSAERGDFVLDHGAVVVAGITSCTNTLQPLGDARRGAAGQEGRREGLTSKPWVKTNMAPGSQVVTDYYEKAGLWPYLEKLGYYLGGYGCTTCIGNTGPLPEEISARRSTTTTSGDRGARVTATSRAASTPT